MSRHLGHPDPETLARTHLSGRIAAHVVRCARCAKAREQLDAVRAALASAPVPPLPEHAKQRVLSAITTEVIIRQGVPRQFSGQDPVSGDHGDPRERSLGEPACGGRGRGRSTRRVARSRQNPARPDIPRKVSSLLVSVMTCVLLAGLGYVLSSSGISSASLAAAVPVLGAATTTLGATMPGVAVSAASGSAVGRGRSESSHVSVRAGEASARPSSGSMAIGPSPGASPAFLVTESRMNYEKATLQTQIRERQAGGPSSAGDQGASGVPSSQLVGCVLHLTGGVPPSFVDRATYEQKPAYVFAVPYEAWVVEVDCTASHPALITSVRLITSGYGHAGI